MAKVAETDDPREWNARSPTTEYRTDAGAIFDMVRDANAAADKGEFKQGDVEPLLKALLNHSTRSLRSSTTTTP